MDVELLARVQFAVTVMFHYIYPPLSIGIGLGLVFLEGAYLYTKETLYKDAAKFWTKIFALTFAIGVATGIVMEFEFGTNWATYSNYVGDVFGSALAAEGVFAFFLESGFLALLLFGWDKVGPRLHFFSTLMVCLGAHFSAVWIVVANSWMQTPAGYHIVGQGLSARAEITSFWEMVFNPSSMTRLSHVIFGAWCAGAFLFLSVASWYIYKKRDLSFAKVSFKLGLGLATLALLLQLLTGHESGELVAKHQPMKLASFESLFKTEEGAGMYLFGIVNTKEKKVEWGLKVPYLLSFLAKSDPHAKIAGLDEFPQKDWPHTASLFQIYRLMIYAWGSMVLITIYAWWFLKNGSLEKQRSFLLLVCFSVLLPQIANQAGWVSAEMGRYPWIVYNQLRITDGLSKTVTENQVLSSLIMFSSVYLMLFGVFLYLLNHKIQAGPYGTQKEESYHTGKRLLSKK